MSKEIEKTSYELSPTEAEQTYRSVFEMLRIPPTTSSLRLHVSELP